MYMLIEHWAFYGAIICCVIIVIWQFYRRRAFGRSKLLQNPLVHQEMIDNAREAVERACNANDPHQLKRALIRWAEAKWPERIFLGLSNVADYVSGRELQHRLEQLDSIMYTSAAQQWNGKEFWRLFCEERDG